MAGGKAEKSCTVVLHDDRISKQDVLCGTDVLPEGKLGILTAKDARPICVVSKARAPGQKEISLNISLAKRFGFENRMPAIVTQVSDTQDVVANHVEFYFRDICLSRADMWQMVRLLNGGVIYKDQQIRFQGSQTANACAVYINGHEADSALLLRPKTKTIWRSGSARFTLLVQLSKEMLEGWNGGQLMYERLVEGYLAELFQRWEQLKMRHHFSIVLFGRISNSAPTTNGSHEQQYGRNDFYQVICEDIPSVDWHEAIQTLKHVFNDIRLPRQVSLAAQGNMLEAMYLSALDIVDDSVDPRFSSTGMSIIAVTAGCGFFDSDHALLKRTTNLLLGNSIGVDIVALSPKPLHPVPLFKYTLGGDTEFALPHWADVSYWQPQAGFVPESVQSSSLEDVGNVTIEQLSQQKNSSTASTMKAIMDDFDYMQHSDRTTALSLDAKKTLAVGTSIESNKTTKGKPAPTSLIEKPAHLVNPDQSSAAALPTSKPVGIVPKLAKDKPSHPLLQTGRKISVGPRGLAPTSATASTTISTESAGITTDNPTAAFTPNEASSGLAKQIRESLTRKPSQQSLISQLPNDRNKAAKPINIQHGTISSISELDQSDGESNGEVTYKDLTEDKQSSPHLSRTPKPFPSLGSLPETEAQDLAQQALTPWLTLLNPCNPRRDNMRIASQYRKWHHVFPKAIDSGAFKWDSMCSPAALPLSTDLVPTARELDKHYDKKIRRLVLSSVTDGALKPATMLQRLISLRLARGFQIVAKQTKPGVSNSITLDGPVLMSIGTLYHQIEIVSDLELQIIEYTANTHSDLLPNTARNDATDYRPLIGALSSSVLSRPSVSLASTPPGGDWAGLDQALIDGAIAPQANPKSRMRLVLIPVDISKQETENGTIRSHDLLDDTSERRTDGIQKLTQLWQRHRIFTAEDQSRQVSLARPKLTNNVDRDPNPLAIDFQTRDPSAIVNSQDLSVAGELANSEMLPPLFADSEKYHSSNFDLPKLVKQIQEPPPRGVELRDRRWFTRMHLKCFRGDEMTNWLLVVFKDIQTREDAVAMGNDLMDRGIFNHVRGKHAFRDGNYFYQIASAHRTSEYPDTAGFFAKGLGRSVPPTPMLEARFSPLTKALQDHSESSSNSTPSAAPLEKRQILLSQVLQYDMDPARKSEEQEIVNLHCGK